MDRDYGPFRLGPVDLLVAVNALRFIVLPLRQRIFWIGLVIFLGVLLIFNAYSADWFGAALILFLLALFLIFGPMLSGRRRPSVCLRVTDLGLLAISDETENLYKRVDVDRMRVIWGRLLVPVNKSCVLIAPVRAIGATGIQELEASLRELAAKDQPTA